MTIPTYLLSREELKEIKLALAEHGVVSAIKACRNDTGAGLKEAKEFVDHMQDFAISLNSPLELQWAIWKRERIAPEVATLSDLTTVLLEVAEISTSLKARGLL